MPYLLRNPNDDKFRYLNVYEIDLGYGGPEEGGWWYNTGTAIESHLVHIDNFDQMYAALKAKYPEAEPGTRFSYSSVIYAGGDYRVSVERQPAVDFPDHRPHYC